jgi:hypothetical protein
MANTLDAANKAARLRTWLISLFLVNAADAAVHDATRRAIGRLPVIQA